jgi:hypothetical protein
MTPERKGQRSDRVFVPRIESLEDRTVPDGNVQVAFVGHTLFITGDNADNQVWLAGDTSHGAVVRSLDGTTTIDGQLNPLFVTGVRDVAIVMGNGNDTVLVSGLQSRGALSVQFGSGSNNLDMDDVGYSQQTYIRAGGGFSNFTFADSVFHNNVNINTGGGMDQINAFNIRLDKFWMLNPSATNTVFVNIQNSTILEQFRIGAFAPGTVPPSAVDPSAPAPAPPTVVAPTVQLLSSAPNPTGTSPIPFTANFSAPVTGFNPGSVQVVNGTLSSFAQVNAQTYTFVVKPSAPGPVTVTVLGGAATDANGNTNSASNTLSLMFN